MLFSIRRQSWFSVENVVLDQPQSFQFARGLIAAFSPSRNSLQGVFVALG